MRARQRWPDETQAQEDANRQTASLAGVAITLLILVIGLLLVRELHAQGQVEDCLLAGRADCDTLISPPP